MWRPHTLALLLGSLIFLPLSSAQNNCRGDKSIAGYCTPLTYRDTTDDFEAPPRALSCQDTCAGINADLGDWLVDFSADADGVQHRMLLYPCGFAVARGDGAPRDARLSLANQDILDLYDESLRRFGARHADGRISAEGTMRCGDLVIKWYIEDLSA